MPSNPPFPCVVTGLSCDLGAAVDSDRLGENMSTSELFANFEADPTDHKAFEALVKAAIAADDRDSLTQVYERLPEWAPDGETSRLFQVLCRRTSLSSC